MFTAIRNGQLIRRRFIVIKNKKVCEPFLQVMWDEGFILCYKKIKNDKIKIYLKYKNNKPVIRYLKTLSKPGRPVYYSLKQIWKLDSSKIFIIFSTNKGVKSINECKKLKIGGEPFIVMY